MMGAVGEASFRLVGGVAKPVDAAALLNFKKLQVQLARFEPLKIDGDIGPTTVRIYNKYSGRSPGTTVSGLAIAVVPSTSWMTGVADVQGKPPAQEIPPSRSRTVQTPQGPVLEEMNTVGEDSFMDTALNFVTSPMGMIAGAAVVGLIILSKRKKSSASAAPSAVAPVL
jgi:hypothetical protein